MPVHLYGQPCEMDKIMGIAKKYNLYVVEDNAQSHLAKYDNQITGSFGDINATSFYPTKNIGAFGEAGCITTMSKKLSDYVTKYRNYGSSEKYFCDIIGSNSRLDELQAAILNIKLKYIEKWTLDRQRLAKKYDQLLSKNYKITIPYINPKAQHVYHLYVIKVDKRDQLQEFLKEKGIGTSIHYPIPPHLQKAYAHLGYKKGDFPIAEELANTALSLPVYPGLKDESIIYICNLINEFFKN
jgi:dTDP-4-amino-4,6-dideoxygalactose transaminase